MRILLTGANGNLGSALRASGSSADFLTVGRSDWSTLPQLLASGVDAVIHAAWDLTTSVARHPESVLEANLMTTARLLEACRASGVPRFGLISTCAVYGDSLETDEDSPCCPVTINGITKLLNERIVEAACIEGGIDCQIYRVFNSFGGRDRFSILSHLRAALDRDTAFTMNNGGEAERDFIHVSDVARIVLQLIGRQLAYVHVNVGTGRATRIADIVEVVRKHRPELRIANGSVREAARSRADTSRLQSILGELQFVDVMDFVEREFGPSRTPT